MLCRAACNVPGGVDLQQLVLYLDVSVYTGVSVCAISERVCLSTSAFVLHWEVSVYQSLFCTCTCLSTRAFVAPGYVCL
jgi:hypothetical protein